MTNAYDRLLAAIGDEWRPRVYCDVRFPDFDPDPDTICVEVRRFGRWARIPVPEALVDEPFFDLAGLIREQATIAWEVLAQPPPDPVS